MKSILIRHSAITLAMVSLLVALPACVPPTPQTSKPDNTVVDWPLKFRRHNFGAGCYSTYGCKVRYDNFLHLDEPDDELQPSSESIGPNYLDYLDGGYLGIQNFPPPADIRWRSRDGQPNHAVIDIGEIFKNQLILHNVPKTAVAEDTSVGDPAIIMEINNRTINVYIRARIPTKEYQIPGNQYSKFRDDLILAYSHTY